MGDLNEQVKDELNADELNDLLEDNSVGIGHIEEEEAMLAAFDSSDDGEYTIPTVDTPDADDLTEIQNQQELDKKAELDEQVELDKREDEPKVIPVAESTETPNIEPTDIEKIEQRLKRDQAGKFGELIAEVKSLKDDLAESKKAAVKVELTPEQQTEADNDAEVIKMLEEEFPEFDKALIAKMKAQRAEIRKEVMDEVRKEFSGMGSAEDLNTMVDDKITAANESDKQADLISARYSNWNAVVHSDDYKSWLTFQDAATQTTAKNTNSAQEAIKILDSYSDYVNNEQSKALKQQNKQERLRQNIPATLSTNHNGNVDNDPDGEKAFLAAFDS